MTPEIDINDSQTEFCEQETKVMDFADVEAVMPNPRPKQTWSGEEISRKILPCILNIGESLMRSGADVNHVERLISQLGKAYGATHMNVFVITESIIVTMTIADGREYTQTRRIGPTETNFWKLERMNKFCRSVRHMPLPPDELIARFDEVDLESKRENSWLYAGALLVGASYTVFFGGNALDAAVSAVLSVILCFLVLKLSDKTPNLIGFNVIASFIIGILVCAAGHLLPTLSLETTLSGIIMVVIPGLAMTNSIRDMLSGDTLAGLMRFAESILWTAALVFGFTVAFMLMGLSVHTEVPTQNYLIKYAAVLPATVGILLFDFSRRKLFILGIIGAMISYPFYVLIQMTGPSSEFLPVFTASIVAAVYSEILAHKWRVPTAVFFAVAVMPLIPGRLLFSTVNFVVQSNWAAASEIGNTAAMTSLGIATAICIVWTISRTWENLRISKHVAKLVP